MDNSLVVGIDLGTTNSEIAAFSGDQVRILRSPQGAAMLPSCVGLGPAGEVLVGEPARNQLLIYPERTIRSIKRKMGSAETVKLGDQAFTPQEISALILRELAGWASRQLEQPVKRAVITVPAYFSDAQRQATREAGALAGLEVLRILNEPTAASLAYGFGAKSRQRTLIYDLGGGTFDVSLVNLEGEVTEVLASHGNNHLGGDDFDQLILEWMLEEFQKQHKVDLRQGHDKALARLRWAAEDAKKELSFEPYTRIRQESLAKSKGKPLHLDLELSRREFEAMIRPLLQQTLASVSTALKSAGMTPSDLDAVLLVGGSTRIPLVSELLTECTARTPHQDVDPDLAVGLGAGVLASRLSGKEVERVLVDVSPYTFGTSYLGERGGFFYPHCFKPILPRNTPLPLTRSEVFYTALPYQEKVEWRIFQGEDEDALRNILIGDFLIEGLQKVERPNEVLCRMSLNIDGILEVSAIEKATGLSKRVVIDGALRKMTAEDIAAARRRLNQLGGQEELEWEDAAEEETLEPIYQQALELLARLSQIQPKMHEDDQAEADQMRQRIQAAVDERDADTVESVCQELNELLFFVESGGA